MDTATTKWKRILRAFFRHRHVLKVNFITEVGLASVPTSPDIWLIIRFFQAARLCPGEQEQTLSTKWQNNSKQIFIRTISGTHHQQLMEKLVAKVMLSILLRILISTPQSQWDRLLPFLMVPYLIVRVSFKTQPNQAKGCHLANCAHTMMPKETWRLFNNPTQMRV
jgi:hypothetical protein